MDIKEIVISIREALMNTDDFSDANDVVSLIADAIIASTPEKELEKSIFQKIIDIVY